jgi:hypothetical protein
LRGADKSTPPPNAPGGAEKKPGAAPAPVEPPEEGAGLAVEEETAGGVQKRGGPAAPPAMEGGAPLPAPGRFPEDPLAGIRTGGGAIKAAKGSPESAAGAAGAAPYTLDGGAMSAARGS